MECPHCHAGTRVLESRGAEAGAAVRRRRQCSGCGRRFTTYERYERLLFVRKRNGDREAFDREKLHAGLARAAHKRPVTDQEVDAIVDLVAGEVEGAGGELPAQRIGEICLESLGALDRGAYLQFAGTLPSEDAPLFENSVFAGSLPGGSVRSESNSPGSPQASGQEER